MKEEYKMQKKMSKKNIKKDYNNKSEPNRKLKNKVAMKLKESIKS